MYHTRTLKSLPGILGLLCLLMAPGAMAAPVAQDGPAGTDEDTAVVITLVATDVDHDASSLTYELVAGPANGGVTISGAQATYTPSADYNGADSFTFLARDPDGLASNVATVAITVTAVNDAPFVANAIGSVDTVEDGPDIVLDLSTVFGDVDIATNGDVLTFALVNNDNGTLFESTTLVDAVLTLKLAFDQYGVANIEVSATDTGGLTVSDHFVVNVASVNDLPEARDDAASMLEGGAALIIDVLANDYLAEQPTLITLAGIDGYSESPPTTMIDAQGNVLTAPNGRVTVVSDGDGERIEYEPKPYFFGTDFFHYTITDRDGDTSTAKVTITVAPVNNPPVGVQERGFSLLEGGSLTVGAANSLLGGAFDADNAFANEDGEAIVVQTLSIQTVSLPAVGTLTIDNTNGTFTYKAPASFTGEVLFEYRLFDGLTFSDGDAYRVRINVIAAPEPAAPPPAGEVAVTYNLANVPLEQSTGVPPNVMVVMDDSGSMDWNLIVAEDENDGVFVMDNDAIATRQKRAEPFSYLWDLANNAYPPSSSFGRILPTEEALAADANFSGNQFGVWRARSHLHNSIYYNPGVRYTPWVGLDQLNQDFADANPTAVRLDPVDPARTFDLLATHSYRATSVPRWLAAGNSTNLDVTVYIPHYYQTSAQPPLAWNAARTKVEIKSGSGPLAGGLFPGGPDRADCALGDGDSSRCTYDQEIQNFANWFQYYRSREYVVKGGMGKVIGEVQDIRIGYLTTSATTTHPIGDMNALYSEGNKKALLETVYKVDSFGGTPLRQMLDRAGKILACEITGQCPRLPAPAGFCQQNFALLFTDGYWTGGAGVSSNADANTASPFDGGRYADTYSATLADTAMFHYKRDLHTDFENLVPVSARDILGAPPNTFDLDKPFMHQHMKTYAIAFGVRGTINPDSVPEDPTVAFSWPDPFAAPAHKIDDLLHAAVNGRGRYLNATNPQELQAALESAFLEFTQAASSTSSAAFNSTSLEEGTLLYRGFYDLRFNTGELTATKVNKDGSLAGDPLWRASEQLDPENLTPNNRKLVSFDATSRAGIAFRHDALTPEQQLMLSEQQVGFLRGERAAEAPLGPLRARELRGALLGDIVNSSPVFVGAPRSINRDQAPYPVDDLYSTFAKDQANRPPVVYVGANDGILHGFSGTTGAELFGYIPNKIIDSSQQFRNALSDFTSPFYQHRYYVDLTPRLNDAYVKTPSNPGSKTWRTVLMGGLGAGGKGFFALDVTDPAGMFATETAAEKAVLWEFTDKDDSYPLDADGDFLGGADGALLDPAGNPVRDLGYSLSLPTVAMSNAADSGDKEWVAIFGNGPNSTAGFARLFVLFLDRGIDGWDDPGDFVKVDTGFGVQTAPHPLAGYPNGLGSPTAVDIDLNGTVDFVYAGDRLGNLFRFDLRDANPDNWSSTRLFTAGYGTGAGATIQPILTQPLVIKHPTEQGFLIIFGTGSFFAREDARNDEIQSIYAIWDRGESAPATANADTRAVRLVEQTLTNVIDDALDPALVRRILTRATVTYQPQNCTSTDCSGDGETTGTYGWYIDLDMPRATLTTSGVAGEDQSGRPLPGPQYPGERAIRRLLFRDGAIITTTVLPALDEFSCFGTRSGSILLFDSLTGGDLGRPLIDFNRDGVIDSKDMVKVGDEFFAGGVLFNQQDLDGVLVDVSTLGGEGGTDFLFVSGGRDTLAYRIEGIDDVRTGRLSWRELDQAN